jgi:predicted AlkP superfamily phosphohydrolase/phosphomutase
MTSSSSKILLFGLDCAIGPRWRRYAERGDLPVGQRLMTEGVFAENCLAALPTLTTTNWMTIATGAWPGTHGVTDFNMHKPGEDLNTCPQAFDSGDCTAEFFWNAAARAGARTILVNYPTTYPPVVENGVQLGGAGIELNESRIGLLAEDRAVTVAADQLFSTEGEPLANPVVVPEGSMTVEMPFTFADCAARIETPVSLYCTPITTDPPPRARLAFSAGGEPVAEIGVGEWSETLSRELVVGGEPALAAFKVKLLDYDPERGLIRLYVTDICRVDGFDDPAGTLGDTSSFRGLPVPGVGYDPFELGWIDLDTFIELIDMGNQWLCDASLKLMKEQDWDIYCTHLHAIDWFYHLASDKLEPALTPDACVRARWEAAELAVYRSMDDAIGRMLDAVQGPALSIVVSDHGATPRTSFVPLESILADAGLLAYVEGTEHEQTMYGYPIPGVDWQRTLAIPQRSCYVYVNLKGRDPDGVVEPEDYLAVREKAIDALQSYRDPESGLCPFSLVLRKEDARVLGLYGDRIGDIVYATREEFGDEHGQGLGTGEWASGSGSMKPLLLFSGPGIKQGEVLERTVWLTDVVPTICHVTGLPLPADAEGAVLYQALEKPDGLAVEYRQLKERYERLEQVVRGRRCTVR